MTTLSVVAMNAGVPSDMYAAGYGAPHADSSQNSPQTFTDSYPQDYAPGSQAAGAPAQNTAGMPSHLAFAFGSLTGNYDGASAPAATPYAPRRATISATAVDVAGAYVAGGAKVGGDTSIAGSKKNLGPDTTGAAGGSQSLNTNTMALNAYRYVLSAHGLVSDSLQRLSSGNRINSAADDAAGLGISESLKTQVLGSKQALRNAQDGISLAQTAEGVLGTVHSMLQRMRVLAVQGANDSNTGSTRGSIASEMDAIRAEIGRIGEATEIMGRRIFGGKYVEPADALRMQVGANATDMETIGITFVNVVDIARAQLQYIPQDADNVAFHQAIGNIDSQITTISEARSSLGAVVNRIEHTISNLNVVVENVSTARSRINDADIAAESARYMRGQILTQSSQAMLSHAIRAPRGVLALFSAA